MIKEISYTRGTTINLGDFNSARIDVSVTVGVEPDDDPAERYAAARAWVRERLHAGVDAIKAENRG